MTSIELSNKYLLKCRDNYFKGVSPANIDTKNSEDYKVLLKIALQWIEEYGEDNFSEFFQEYQYLVDLWTAHFIIEYGNPNEELSQMCLKRIALYTNALSEKVKNEEKAWLLANYPKTLKDENI